MSKVVLKDGSSMNNYQPPKKKMWWRYLLVWFAGFLSFGLITGIVALILSTSFTSGEVLTMFGVDASSILQPYYQGLSILQLATTLPNLKYETLGDIYKITPMVKELFENTVNPVLEKELHFEYDWDEISIKPFSLPVEAREDDSVDTSEDLSTYLGRAIKEGVYLKDFFDSDLPALINLFLYPKDDYGNYDYNNPYCLMDFISADSSFFDSIMAGVKVSDFIENPTGDPLLDEIGNWSINDFTEENINNLSIGLFVDSSTTDPLMQELSTWTISDLKSGTKMDELTLGLFLDSSSSDPFIQEISTWTVADLKEGNKIDSLTIGLFLDSSSSDPLIQELSTWTISDLKDGSKIDNLHIGLF